MSEQAGDRCPLCGSQLAPDQDWCLNCGGAARSRLAPPPRWRPLVAALLLITVLAIGGLAAALTKLAGEPGVTRNHLTLTYTSTQTFSTTSALRPLRTVARHRTARPTHTATTRTRAARATSRAARR